MSKLFWFVFGFGSCLALEGIVLALWNHSDEPLILLAAGGFMVFIILYVEMDL